MATKQCNQCGSTYDDTTVITSPIPDNMCAECGTTLTEEKVQQIIAKFEQIKSAS